MFTCRVKYGPDVEPFQSETPIRISHIRTNQTLKRALGFSDNINLLINQIAMTDDVLVPNDALVVVETAANRKAS